MKGDMTGARLLLVDVVVCRVIVARPKGDYLSSDITLP